MPAPRTRIAVRLLAAAVIALSIPACAQFGKPKTEQEIARDKAEIEAGQVQAAKPLLWSPNGGAMSSGGARPGDTL